MKHWERGKKKESTKEAKWHGKYTKNQICLIVDWKEKKEREGERMWKHRWYNIWKKSLPSASKNEWKTIPQI